MSGFSDKILTESEGYESGQIVEICTGKTADGRDFYAYVAMNLEVYPLFKAAQKEGRNMDLTKLGEILYTGWGRVPPPEVVRGMQEQYNIDPDFEENLKSEYMAMLQGLIENVDALAAQNGGSEL